MSDDDINDYVPSLINPRAVRKQQGDISLTQCSFMTRTSLSLKRINNGLKSKPACKISNKENSPKIINTNNKISNIRKSKDATVIEGSIGYSAIEDLQTIINIKDFNESVIDETEPIKIENPAVSLISLSSATELDLNVDSKSDATVYYDVTSKPTISVSFGLNLCDSVDLSAKNSAIKRVQVSLNDRNTTVDCELAENTSISSDEMKEVQTPPQKRSAVAVSLEIKKNKLSDQTENKVLILNTSAIEKISHVIVQPQNYRIVKGRINERAGLTKLLKHQRSSRTAEDGVARVKLKQQSIDSFFGRSSGLKVSDGKCVNAAGAVEYVPRDEVEMSKNSGVTDGVRSDRVRKSPQKGSRYETTTGSGRVARRGSASPKQEVKTTCSSPRGKESGGFQPSQNVDGIQFGVPQKTVSRRTASTRPIPHHKIVAGTHFAVDAFSYGEIPNVKHYFLTHFHSDHYSGLKKGFSKLLFCSKITADLCISRLGVSPKCIHIVNVDETIKVEGVEVTALEANHCPGAIMLVFTLPNGKTLLHTGDFRASPVMESYPIFWNKDIHTIYLDTTYCNPRYDFPTQEQSLEMALYILRQKKLALEKLGKKFSSVLIVCGTYTIGKEKFFLGMSRRVGCCVWACPEKERVLVAVEGRAAARAPPHACQLHVVPMRDLTHEKLRSYLDSLKGAFAEVVAFKPSGWENGKSASQEKDLVTIHGIPYSEHSSFSELIRFVKFLKPKQVVPTVDISGGVRAVQKYFPCPLVYKDDLHSQSKVTDFYSIQNQSPVPAVT